MADTELNSYPNEALDDTDELIVQTSAGGGKNVLGLRVMSRDANGIAIGGFGAATSAGVIDWNDASNARSGGGVTLLAGTSANGPAAAGGSFFHPFSFVYGPTSAVTQLGVPYGEAGSIGQGLWFRGYHSANAPTAWTSWRQVLCEDAANAFAPKTDNAKSLGKASARFSTVYAATGAISTSDEREKQQIEAVPDTWLDAWGDVEWRRYKFNDAVAEKGDAGARWHVGAVAQQVRDAFAAHGLDAAEIGLIALLCHSEWAGTPAQPEVVNEDGETVTPAQPATDGGDRYGLRYEECAAMEAAYQRRRMTRIEARLAALEGA